MVTALITSLTGFVAGSLHVVTGPDHMAAIAPLAVQGQKKAWISGVRWGIGHASGVLLIGVLSLLFRNVLPIDSISAYSERLVGVMLICIGFWGLRKALRLHVHEHHHKEETHSHIHAHAPLQDHFQPQSHVHKHTAFGIGTLHGLAGSSHFLGIIPALALSATSTVDAAVYLGFFGIGTIIAMGAFALGIGYLANRFAANALKTYKRLMSGCSVAAVMVGVLWLIHPL